MKTYEEIRNNSAIAWTAKKVNDYLEYLTAGDARVERGYNGPKPKREDFPTFKAYLKADAKVDGYVCLDTYRPGYQAWGKTPKLAAFNAGFTLLD